MLDFNRFRREFMGDFSDYDSVTTTSDIKYSGEDVKEGRDIVLDILDETFNNVVADVPYVEISSEEVVEKDGTI